MIKVFYKTIYHFFPKLSVWLNSIDDPRVKKTIYTLSHLLWTGLFLFLVRLGAKRQIKYLLSTDEFKKNLSFIASSPTHKTSHPDTLENLLKRVKPEEIAGIRQKIIARLIRMKCLAAFRLLGIYYMIAIDGTGHLVYKHKVLPQLSYQDQERKSNILLP